MVNCYSLCVIVSKTLWLVRRDTVTRWSRSYYVI